MPQSILELLQEKGAIPVDKQLMKPSEQDLTRGVPVIEIPRKRGISSDFMVYDSVTSPNGAVLVQGPGKVYHGTVNAKELRFKVQRIVGDHPFGTMGRDNSDYYTANREFVAVVAGLSSRLEGN